MKSAKKMSEEIRAKKKKMMEEREVINSDSPSMDAQDVDALSRFSETEALDENHPKESHPMNDESHESEAPLSDETYEMKKKKRMARVASMMSK